MLSIFISKVLTAAFVGSVAFWYILTPYLVQPHSRIVNDLLTKSQLTVHNPSTSSPPETATRVVVENWTKWRLFVNIDGQKDSKEVIFGSSAKPIFISSRAVINMEWRSEYQVEIDVLPTLTARLVVPKLTFNEWGIYNHFNVSVENGVVKIVPRFLFGIPYETIESMYGVPPSGQPDPLGLEGQGDIVGRIPIIGLFSLSNNIDRVIILCYMSVVLCSVIALLIVNNPPGSLDAPEPSKKPSSNGTSSQTQTVN